MKVMFVGEMYYMDYSVGGGPIYPPAPGQPPGSIWPGGRPEHPIYWPPTVWPDPRPPVSGGNPPGIWGGANEPFPTPPIYFPPVGGGGRPPGYPAHPIFWPPHPEHPIVLPPPSTPGEPPLGIWGGSNEPFPTPPIYLPGDKPTDPPKPAEGWSWAYSPFYGWVVVPPGGGGKPQPPASSTTPAKP